MKPAITARVDVDAAIAAAVDRVIGNSFFAAQADVRFARRFALDLQQGCSRRFDPDGDYEASPVLFFTR
jgi:hypothetical protein